jgi:hypothetical protein
MHRHPLRLLAAALALAAMGACHRPFPPNVTPPDVGPEAKAGEAAAPSAVAPEPANRTH